MMSGFEVIVRPSILPDIRPAAPHILTPESDPTQNIAVLSGLGGKLVDLTQSESSSWSRQKAVEEKRTYRKVKVYNVKPDGTVDKSQWVEVEQLQSITYGTSKGSETYTFADPPEVENVEVLETGLERRSA